MLPHPRICLFTLTAGTTTLLGRPCSTDRTLTWSKDVVEAKGHAAAGAGGSRHGSVAAVAAQAGCLSAHQPAGQVRPHPAGDQKACSAQFQIGLNYLGIVWGCLCRTRVDQIQVIGPYRMFSCAVLLQQAAEPFKGACSFWAANARYALNVAL